ncbi:MAG: mobilization protein [Pseudomonadota bacterium]
MSQIHFIGGEKGGIGKSVVARLLAQYHIDRGIPFIAFDTDSSHGALARFYKDFTTEIKLSDFDSADKLMESAVEQPQNVLVDLAAQTTQHLTKWIEDTDLLGIAKEENVQVVLWHVLDDGADGIKLLSELFARFGNRTNYVVVKNYGRGKDFSNFESSPARAMATTLNARVIELPDLHASCMRKIDHLALSFWAAGNNREHGLGLMERQRIKVWLRKAYEQFDQIGSSHLSTVAPPLLNEPIDPQWIERGEFE